MNFNKHLYLEGKHAFLSASKYHWINYTPEKLDLAFSKYKASQVGTRIHNHAAESIELGIKLPRTNKTLNMYVNDAIGYKMKTEVVLYYSDNCFGTADAIVFKRNLLRIHDLKTGTSPTSFNQLLIYAAIFCLEYSKDPNVIDIELRIYQNDDVAILIPEGPDVKRIMHTIISYDERIEKMKEGLYE